MKRSARGGRIWGNLISLLAAASSMGGVMAGEIANISTADGFDLPVGKDGTKQYYKARGFRQNGHLGEDWNGVGGGDTDLGDPVYATARGLVVFARDYRVGWGNVVIIRHAYQEAGETKFVDSLYGHLNEILVREGQQVSRGEKVGTIGTNHGMYDAHLHFEMRKNIQIGMFRSSFARDFSNYWDPTQFVADHHTVAGGGQVAQVPINTFPPAPPPAYAAAIEEGFRLATPPSMPKSNSSSPRGPFKVDRFSDLKP